MPRTLNTALDVYRHVDVGGPDDCWLWTASVSTTGYGQFYFDGRLHTAHRVAWELDNGPVPDGLFLDHLCRERRCCNPRHLEPVTTGENTRRSPIHNGAKTHCPQGHPYDEVNTRRYRGARYCRQCQSRPQSGHDGGPGCPGTVSGR